MEKILLVYYSNSGNTKAMAHAILEGLRKKKAVDIDCVQIGMIHPRHVGEYSKVVLGCPASGREQLEQDVFEPFYQACKEYLRNKPIALFGSYGLGVGHWMKKWEERARKDGAIVFEEGFVCLGFPEDEIYDDLVNFGKRFAEYQP
ncbi:MAG: flavodoxin [Erysipelotrichales bacterium]|nr:MAG: flavodoxin [Erysipelotrichales bacterium]